MNRRELLQCAAVMISGASMGRLAFALSSEQKTYLAGAPSYIEGKADYFSPEDRKVVAAVAEAIIPATETPGAIDAQVPKFIELMVQDWMTDDERALFEQGLAELKERSLENRGKSFDQLTARQQTQLLEHLEDEAGDSSWYEFGNVQRDFVSDAPFICQIKELTVWGFFTSEVGGSQVLRYNPMPMKFDGDIPLGRDESSWLSMF